MTIGRRISPLMAGILIAFLTQPVVATDNTDRKWDPQQFGIYNYSPCMTFESDFPNSTSTGNARSRVAEGRNKWNIGRELYFRTQSGCDKWIHANWNDNLFPFNDDWAFVSNDQWGDISNSDVNYNASPDDGHGGYYQWYWGIGTPPSNLLDSLSITTHEFGHSVALGHTQQCTCDVMYPYINPGQTRRNLSSHDRASISAMYAAVQ